MSAFAPSQYQMPGTGEMPGPQRSDEEIDKLQEIHELINLMVKDLPAITHAAARPCAAQASASVPYAYSFYQFPWNRTPYVRF